MARRIARVVHPAPVVRESADGFGIVWMRCETPCEIPEIDMGRARVVQRLCVPGSAEMPVEVLAHGDELWWRLDGRMPNIGPDPYPGPDDLVAYLEDRLGFGIARSELSYALLHSPVEAGDGRNETRGEARAEPRGIAHDGRGEAEASLRAYVAANLAIAGDRVLVRTDGVLLTRKHGNVPPGQGSPWSLDIGSGYPGHRSRHYRPDRVEEALAFEALLGNADDAIPPGILGSAWIDPAHDHGDGDIVAAVNELTRRMGTLARDRMLGRMRAPERREFLREDDRLRRRIAWLLPWYLKASRGLVGLADAAAAAEACSAMLDAFEEAMGPDLTPGLRAGLRLFGERMLPRLSALGHGGEPADEDVESLLALR